MLLHFLFKVWQCTHIRVVKNASKRRKENNPFSNWLNLADFLNLTKMYASSINEMFRLMFYIKMSHKLHEISYHLQCTKVTSFKIFRRYFPFSTNWRQKTNITLISSADAVDPIVLCSIILQEVQLCYVLSYYKKYNCDMFYHITTISVFSKKAKSIACCRAKRKSPAMFRLFIILLDRKPHFGINFICLLQKFIRTTHEKRIS